MHRCWKEIGKVTALAFVETGANVALMSTKAEFHKTAAECEKFGGKAVFVSADTIKEEQVNEGVKRVSADSDESETDIFRLRKDLVQLPFSLIMLSTNWLDFLHIPNLGNGGD